MLAVFGWCTPRMKARSERPAISESFTSRSASRVPHTHPGPPLDEAGHSLGFSLWHSIAESLKLSAASDGPDETRYADTAPGLFFTRNTAAVEEFASELPRRSDSTLASWMLAGVSGSGANRRECQGACVESSAPTACVQLDQLVAKMLEEEQRKEKELFDLLAAEKRKLAQTRESLRKTENMESSREQDQQHTASACHEEEIGAMKRLLRSQDAQLEAMHLKINELQTRLQKAEADGTAVPAAFQSQSNPSQRRFPPPPFQGAPSTIIPRGVHHMTHPSQDQTAFGPAVDVSMAGGGRAHDPNVNNIEQRKPSSSSLR